MEHGELSKVPYTLYPVPCALCLSSSNLFLNENEVETNGTLSFLRIDLRGKCLISICGNLEVDVGRSEKVGWRGVCLKAVSSLTGGKLCPTMIIIIFALLVGLPPFHPCSRYDHTGACRHDFTADRKTTTSAFSNWRVGFIKRPFCVRGSWRAWYISRDGQLAER